MRGCRDCSRCTESIATRFFLFIPRLIIWILTFWNIGLFQKKCPQCSHRMKNHARKADGTFKD